jgi:hypothetical protein
MAQDNEYVLPSRPVCTLSSLPAPSLVRHRYRRRRQLLAVGTNAFRLAPGVGLRLSNDGPPPLIPEIPGRPAKRRKRLLRSIELQKL